jgi:hypothetical protein
VDISIAPTFKISVPIFNGILDNVTNAEKEYDLEVRIHIEVDDKGNVSFELSIPGLEKAKLAARREIVRIIRSRLAIDDSNESKSVFVGMGERQVREYVGEIDAFGETDRVINVSIVPIVLPPRPASPEAPQRPPFSAETAPKP